MYSAVWVDSGEQVVILAPQWRSRLGDLRGLCADDRLICPVCRQPVWARAGELRRWHFGHKHLSDCPSGRESPELLQARAVLYEWLVAKFGAATVQIEKKFGGNGGEDGLPRHFDCVVDSAKGQKLAYWVFDRQVKPGQREIIPAFATAAEHLLVPVFTTSLMRRNEVLQDVLNLSTTERRFLLRGTYDDLYPHDDTCKGSLHYLDGEQETLTTLRAMSCTEPPQQYAGTEITSTIGNVNIHGPTGQFVHPGEWERMKEYRQRLARERRRHEERRLRAEQARRAIEERQERESAERRELRNGLGIGNVLPATGTRLAGPVNTPPPPPPDPIHSQSPPPSVYNGRKAPCELCGATTPEPDWIIFDGRTALCKCRSCMRAGRATRRIDHGIPHDQS